MLKRRCVAETKKGYASAYDFAVDVISQTQGVYNKANRSNWAHSQLGAPLLVFKQFSINYVEQMIRMLKNQNAGEEGKKQYYLCYLCCFRWLAVWAYHLSKIF